MTTPRRDFLGWVGAAAVLGATPSVLSAQPTSDDPPAPKSSDWDMSWVERMKGKHRAVFDAPEISDGFPVIRASLWGKQYADVYGTKPGETNAVLVVRHHGIAMAMDDDYWSRFEVGKEAGIKTPAGAFMTVNPVRKEWPETPEPFRKLNLAQFQADGGIVLACNLAFSLLVVPKYQEAMKVSAEEATKAAKSHLLPGVTLQPSGFFAVARAQEAGCHFVPAS